jgi:hypothetical protein
VLVGAAVAVGYYFYTQNKVPVGPDAHRGLGEN